MHGYLRYFLSILVVLSHIGFTVSGFNQGVSAVVVFFMLAGYVVTGLLGKTNYDLKLFYIDRFMRIYPTYLITLFISVVFVFAINHCNPIFTKYNIISHLTIIPLDYYWLKLPIVFTSGLRNTDFLNPQAWSLGLELQAYILLPFILKNRKVKAATLLFSILFFIIISLSDLNSDQYNYRFILGNIFIFIIGSYIYEHEHLLPKQNVITSIYLFIIAITLFTGLFFDITKPYLREELIGLIIGIPTISYLKSNIKKSKISVVFGGMSYGIFISHFLFIYLFEHYLPQLSAEKIKYMFIIVFCSSLYSLIIYKLVDKKIEKIRFEFTNLTKT